MSLPDPTVAIRLFFRILCGDGGRSIARALRGGEIVPQVKEMLLTVSRSRGTLKLVGRVLRALGQASMADFLDGLGFSSGDQYWQSVEAQHDYREAMRIAMEKHEAGPVDVLIGPVCSLPAVPLLHFHNNTSL